MKYFVILCVEHTTTTYPKLVIKCPVTKVLNFSFTPRTKNTELINVFHQHLEEIYGLSLLRSTPLFTNCLPKLTVLDIRCSIRQLLKILPQCPKVQRLNWWESLWLEQEDWEEVFNFDTISLIDLTRLVLGVRYNDSMHIIKKLASLCLHVKSLRCQIENPCKISWIYVCFPQLEEFELYQNGGLSILNVTGVQESSLNLHIRKPVTPSRPRLPYIGQFANLRVLNFGLVDYQRFADCWRWDINLRMFPYGICDLINLSEMIFPPMKIQTAENILQLIAHHMKQVKVVRFQIWFARQVEDEPLGLSHPGIKYRTRRRPGYWNLDLAMKRWHVETLKSKYLNKFEVQAIEVKERDDIHEATS